MQGVRSSGNPYRNAALSGILYLVRSAAYCLPCGLNSRALHAQTGPPWRRYARARGKFQCACSFCMAVPALLLYWLNYDKKCRRKYIYFGFNFILHKCVEHKSRSYICEVYGAAISVSDCYLGQFYSRVQKFPLRFLRNWRVTVQELHDHSSSM